MVLYEVVAQTDSIVQYSILGMELIINSVIQLFMTFFLYQTANELFPIHAGSIQDCLHRETTSEEKLRTGRALT